jgi:UDP-glucose 4-epimerase
MPPSDKFILVTGGAGYIGSHVCVELLQRDYRVIVIDNLSNSKIEAPRRVRQISGKPLLFKQIDLLDKVALESIFDSHDIHAVMHFAGLKAVGESVEKPLWYYHNNVHGALNLLHAMERHAVRNMVFSSSATVYGDPASNPIGEDFPLGPTNPYGRTKLHIEDMLRDLHRASPAWNISILRYFNPVGAHASGLIGEDPGGVPNNLMPYVAQTATGLRQQLSVFGSDYPTRDGTGVRDYIHVVDLACGHIKALEKLAADPGCITHNLGTGQGYSVLEMVAAFEQASGRPVPYQLVERRAGDIAECYADPARASDELGWRAEKDLGTMCADTWNWQSRNPRGYDG